MVGPSAGQFGGAIGLAGAREHGGESDAGRFVIRVFLEGGLEVQASDGDLVFLEHAVALGGLDVGLGGDEGVEEGADLFLGDCADEAVDELSADEGEDGGDALDLERLGDLGVLVGVDLDELDLAVALVGESFKDRSEDAAGAAPRGPAVDDDGNLV